MACVHRTESKEETNNLLETEAALRAKQISNVTYELRLTLPLEDVPYTGSLVATFDYKDAGSDVLFLDYTGKEVQQFTVNDADLVVDGKVKRDNRLYIPTNLLKSSNTVIIKYKNDFDHSGGACGDSSLPLTVLVVMLRAWGSRSPSLSCFCWLTDSSRFVSPTVVLSPHSRLPPIPGPRG